MRYLLLLLCAIAFLWLVVGCSDDPVEPPLVTICITNCQEDTVYLLPRQSWTYVYEAEINVDLEWPEWHTVLLDGPFSGTYSNGEYGYFHIVPDTADWGKTFNFAMIVELLPRVSDTCYLTFAVKPRPPALFRITRDSARLGEQCEVSIEQVSGRRQMGGFDLLLGYEAEALTFIGAQLGAALGESGCGWEYFDYSWTFPTNCNGPCPTGLVRLVAIAEQNNGNQHPACFGGDGELARLTFQMTDDPNYECLFLPIRFVWRECSDNGVSNVFGDTLFVSTNVYDFLWDGVSEESEYLLTNDDCDSNWTYRYGGVCDSCDQSDKSEIKHNIIFWNGGIDNDCSD